jgi:hypothetical protein
MSHPNKDETVNMSIPTRRTTEVQAAFREAGIDDVRVEEEGLVLDPGGGPKLTVIPVAIASGRPEEVRAALEVKPTRSARTLKIFVARHFSPGAIQLLQSAGASYLDDRRFVVRVERPFVHISRDRVTWRPVADKPTDVRLAGRVGVAVQAMLMDWKRPWMVTELAETAAISVGSAQLALQRLERLGVVRAEGSGPGKRRTLTDAAKVLDLWAADAKRERTTLVTAFLFAQGGADLTKRVSERLASGKVVHGVTGASAALIVAPHVTTSDMCEVWVAHGTSPELALGALDARAEMKGANVRVMSSPNDAPLFRTHDAGGIVIVNDLRLYSDLLADPRRGEEQAAFLRESKLGF